MKRVHSSGDVSGVDSVVLGLSAEELFPDFSALCRFRARLGAEGFETMFNQVVEQARSRGFITDRLHIRVSPPTSRWKLTQASFLFCS